MKLLTMNYPPLSSLIADTPLWIFYVSPCCHNLLFWREQMSGILVASNLYLLRKKNDIFTTSNNSLCPLTPLNKIWAWFAPTKYLIWSNLPHNEICLFFSPRTTWVLNSIFFEHIENTMPFVGRNTLRNFCGYFHRSSTFISKLILETQISMKIYMKH